MKKADVKLGHTYVAKISGRLVPVRLDAEAGRGWSGTNLRTKRRVRILSAAKLRYEYRPA